MAMLSLNKIKTLSTEDIEDYFLEVVDMIPNNKYPNSEKIRFKISNIIFNEDCIEIFKQDEIDISPSDRKKFKEGIHQYVHQLRTYSAKPTKKAFHFWKGLSLGIHIVTNEKIDLEEVKRILISVIETKIRNDIRYRVKLYYENPLCGVDATFANYQIMFVRNEEYSMVY